MIVKLDLERTTAVIADDPVRPHIPAQWRCSQGRSVLALEQEGRVRAVICTALTDTVPTCEADMDTPGSTVAVFYTVWSYERGAGRDMVFAAQQYLAQHNPNVQRWVTLSPLTTMAEQFHTRNGAQLIGRYATAQNFEYSRK